jgi:hypothetical protein
MSRKYNVVPEESVDTTRFSMALTESICPVGSINSRRLPTCTLPADTTEFWLARSSYTRPTATPRAAARSREIST